MEDYISISFGNRLVAAFDGHGGHFVSSFAQKNFYSCFLQGLPSLPSPHAEEASSSAFNMLEKELKRRQRQQRQRRQQRELQRQHQPQDKNEGDVEGTGGNALDDDKDDLTQFKGTTLAQIKQLLSPSNVEEWWSDEEVAGSMRNAFQMLDDGVTQIKEWDHQVSLGQIQSIIY
jgi:hypothetical protein